MFLFWWRCKYIRCRYNARTDDFHYYLTIFHYTLLYSVFSIILSRKRKCRTLPLSPPAPPRPPLPTTATKSPSPARLTPTLLSTSTNPWPTLGPYQPSPSAPSNTPTTRGVSSPNQTCQTPPATASSVHLIPFGTLRLRLTDVAGRCIRLIYYGCAYKGKYGRYGVDVLYI